MYDRILVPTDGSDPASEAVDYAFDLAEFADATVHALFVADSDRANQGAPGISVDSLRDSLVSHGRDTTEAVAKRGGERGIPVETAVLEGLPQKEISEYARSHHIDIVVMGTHGRTGLDRVVTGSVTEATVRSCPVPVLTV